MTNEERLERLEKQHEVMSQNFERMMTLHRKIANQVMQLTNRILDMERRTEKYKLIDGHLASQQTKGKGNKKK